MPCVDVPSLPETTYDSTSGADELVPAGQLVWSCRLALPLGLKALQQVANSGSHAEGLTEEDCVSASSILGTEYGDVAVATVELTGQTGRLRWSVEALHSL